MDIYHAIADFCQKHNLLPSDSTIVIGLSGGPDSVFLFHFLRSIAQEKNLRLIAAHLDHQWRVNSADDRAFCQALAAQHNIPFISTTADQIVLNKAYNGSHEEVARNKRRHFFATVAAEHKADRIALAHHRDDQQETFFIRLMRGATLDGIVGMRPQTGLYVRPLLTTSKQEILAYLHQHNYPFMHDHTNESDLFLRNRIRNNALPVLKSCDTRFDHHFDRLLSSLQEANDFISSVVEHRLQELTVQEADAYALNITLLQQQEGLIKKRILLRWLCDNKIPFVPSTAFLDEILRFFFASSASTHTLGTTWFIEKRNNFAWLRWITQQK